MIVGMMLYLCGNSILDTPYAVNCAERLKHLHGLALNRIGHYVKAACESFLIMNPTSVLKIYWLADADFSKIYDHEQTTDTNCAKSYWI